VCVCVCVCVCEFESVYRKRIDDDDERRVCDITYNYTYIIYVIYFIHLYTSGGCSCRGGNIIYIYVFSRRQPELFRRLKKKYGRRRPNPREETSSYINLHTYSSTHPPRAVPHHFHRQLSNDVVSTFAPPRNFPARKQV